MYENLVIRKKKKTNYNQHFVLMKISVFNKYFVFVQKLHSFEKLRESRVHDKRLPHDELSFHK
jgi:hypothetical protein